MLAYCSIDAISLCCKHFLMWQFYRPLWFVWADIWANTLSPLQNSPCTFCTLCTLSLSPLQNCIVKTNSLRHMCWCPDSRKASHFRRSSVDTFYYWCYFTAPILKTTLVCQAVVYTDAHALSPLQNSLCTLSPLQNYVVYTAEAHWALYKTHSATHVGALTPVSTMYNAHCTKYIVHIHTPDPCLNPCLGSLGKSGCKEYCCWWFRI